MQTFTLTRHAADVDSFTGPTTLHGRIQITGNLAELILGDGTAVELDGDTSEVDHGDDVALEGTAVWDASTNKPIRLSVVGARRFAETVLATFDQLEAATGSHWDGMSVEAHLARIRG